MIVKSFVVGHPGSGKSTVVRRLDHLAKLRMCRTVNLQDYDILREMFLKDSRHEKFYPTEYDGFNILDYSVCDIALKRLEEKLLEEIKLHAQIGTQMPLFVTIELARDDYRMAFRQFSPGLVRTSHVFFVDADLETCIERVKKRFVPSSQDRHYVSEDTMRSYYCKDNWYYMSTQFQAEFEIMKEVVVYRNTGQLPELFVKAGNFADAIFNSEFGGVSSLK
jgi:predicted ABC-type ATPase